jgi:hypothetical protein
MWRREIDDSVARRPPRIGVAASGPVDRRGSAIKPSAFGKRVSIEACVRRGASGCSVQAQVSRRHRLA